MKDYSPAFTKPFVVRRVAGRGHRPYLLMDAIAEADSLEAARALAKEFGLLQMRTEREVEWTEVVATWNSAHPLGREERDKYMAIRRLVEERSAEYIAVHYGTLSSYTPRDESDTTRYWIDHLGRLASIEELFTEESLERYAASDEALDEIRDQCHQEYLDHVESWQRYDAYCKENGINPDESGFMSPTSPRSTTEADFLRSNAAWRTANTRNAMKHYRMVVPDEFNNGYPGDIEVRNSAGKDE